MIQSTKGIQRGNYLYIISDTPTNPEHKELFIVNQVGENTLIDINGNIGGLDDFELISITEKWLKKLGFKEFTKGDAWEHEQIYFELVKQKKDGLFIEAVNIFEYYHGEPFQYIHQLQNLFYARTHRELTIQDNATK